MFYLSRVIFEGLLCGGTQERRSHNHAMLDSDEQTVLFKTGQERGELERLGPHLSDFPSMWEESFRKVQIIWEFQEGSGRWQLSVPLNEEVSQLQPKWSLNSQPTSMSL